jgi:hypothetical protein
MMDLLKKNFEKLLLAIALVVVVATAVILFLRAKAIADQIRNPPTVKGPISVPIIDKRKYDRHFQQIKSPFQWRSYDHRVFAPSLFYKTPPPDIKLVIWEDMDRNKNNIDDSWEHFYGLPVLSAAQQEGEKDPDGDGFNNREEYLDGTNPLDPASRPSYAMKLEVASVTDESTRIQFVGAMTNPGGDHVAILTVTDPAGRKSETVRHGSVVAGYTVEKFNTDERGRSILSIVLTRGLPGDKPQILEVGKEIILEDKSVEIRNIVDNILKNYRETEVLEIRGEKFVVIKIDTQSRKVIIQDLTGKKYELPFPSPKGN